MFSGRRHRLWVSALLASALGASACASTTGIARPSPFPLASPPSDLRPLVLQPSAAPDPRDLLQTALGFRGVPYRLGGESPSTGFDCSGFVRYVFAANHLELPRTVGEQYLLGTPVKTRDIRAGDLVYFSTVTPGASHVGIAVDAVEFVHAPGANGAVRVERLDSSYWHERFLSAKRVF
jgi:cell wall-associated NlpC family hydrolase